MKNETSSMEYLMTYGWAILIVIVVACALYSMGIFKTDQKIDGYLILKINNITIEHYLGHLETINFCRGEHKNFSCKDIFIGCGAFNCECELT